MPDSFSAFLSSFWPFNNEEKLLFHHSHSYLILTNVSNTQQKGNKMIDIDAMMKDSREIFGEQNQLEAVKQNGYAIQYIHSPSESVQLEAVKKDGTVIQFIHSPSESVQLEAVKKEGTAIRFIHSPSESVQLEAVKQNGWAIRFFKKAWRKNTAKKMTVSEIETLLGHKVEVVSE